MAGSAGRASVGEPGQAAAFAFFKGTCTRGIYDNMKTAVETVFVGKDQVGLVRERFFTPRLRVKSLAELNRWLVERCVAYAQKQPHLELKSLSIWCSACNFDPC